MGIMENGLKQILVVDDDEQVLFVWSSALAKRACDCRVVTAQDGFQALDRMQESEFDLVITDLKMPGMDGYELTEAIRKTDPDITIVWLTGYRSTNTQDVANRLSVFRCLDKPLTVAQIRQLVDEALAR